MKYVLNTVYAVILAVSILSCGDFGTQQKDKVALDRYGNEIPITEVPLPEVPNITSNDLANLKGQVKQVDIDIFTKGPGATFVDSEASDFIDFFEVSTANLDRKCNSEAMATLQMEDGTSYLVEIFPGDKCSYGQFVLKNQAVFVAPLSAKGKTYFASILD
jgi:hypothetical protein